MKATLFPHLCWAFVAVAAFILGSFTINQPIGNATNASLDRAAGGESSTAGPGSAALIDTANVQEATSLSLERARVLTFDVLREPNQIERLRRLCNLLAQVSPENWRGVIDGFERRKTFEGREYQDEWRLTLERVGEVAASAAVEDTLQGDGPDRNDRAITIFIGWTGYDPDAALAWFDAQTPDVKEKFKFALLQGLARSAPEKALKLGEMSSFAFLDDTPFRIVRGAVDRGGFASAEQLLEGLRHSAEVTDNLKRQVFRVLSEKKVLMSGLQGHPLEALHWLDGYLGNDSPADGTAVHQIVDSAARTDAAATLQWLEQRAHLLNAEQANAAFPPAIVALWQKDRAQFNDWIAANPDHPQYDLIAESLALSLRHTGQLPEARQWNSTIRDEEIRKRMENIIRSAESAQAANAAKKAK
jgi:hypothetical protein